MSMDLGRVENVLNMWRNGQFRPNSVGEVLCREVLNVRAREAIWREEVESWQKASLWELVKWWWRLRGQV
jgi:hypothetical protein